MSHQTQRCRTLAALMVLAGAASSSAVADQCVLDPAKIALTQYPYINAFYTGFDGGTDNFSLLLQGRNSTVTVADPSVAKVSQVSVQVTAAQIQTLLTAAQKTHPNLTAQRIQGQFGNTRTAYVVTGLKAGSTTLSITRTGTPGAPGGAGQGPTGGLKGTSQVFLLNVIQYSPDAIAKGKARYTAELDADNPACATCHLSGKDGAPSHALGTESTIPDVALDQWVTTGQMPTLKANIPHAWKFRDADEQQGVIGYVRSLEANNLEAFLVAEFNFEFGTTIDPSTLGN